MATIVITGASDGIGAAAAAQIAASGEDRLVLVGRSPQKTRAVAERTGAEHLIADYADLSQVHEAAAVLLDRCDRIDVLANNAGGLFPGPILTPDGFEQTFQINHLAPFLLTHLLMDRLVDSGAAIVNTASIAAKLYARPDMDDFDTQRGYGESRAYGNAKLANILHAKGLHARFHSRGISAMAFHPGVIATNFASGAQGSFRGLYHGLFSGLLTRQDTGGARLAHFLRGEPGTTWRSGEFYGPKKRISRTHPVAADTAFVDEHWRRSAEMLGLRDTPRTSSRAAEES
ncbi:SDR family NAD(P)-dependent oxidoreductase [Microbacterium amylolyticum]|uniref:NAD(P)-dependent dehydrogenase (Short-subunit alcohol dehydrogenase family) n=1 Tax=Microbacterium amylolyticum TaxID=936337 RepID=A0ABS4ZFC5_9MICO|nr:SDR family NAD(P)-dependent oxidoreductase [Microbacterium amylolyticum]MBP2435981.1 NAD(P)-dependent dehydrogenase (short-subunit alcohol dehydrogenase family) [Microbacterium amylolyticum]